MDTIKAKVRNGRIETDEPLNLPDGTELLILRPNGTHDSPEEDWDNTPAGIAAWLKWYDSLQPLIFTAEERQALESDQEARREWELSRFDEHGEKLRGRWE
jgi:hypothetical protein